MPRTTSKRPMTRAEYMARNRSLLASSDTRSPLEKAVNWTPNKTELVRNLLSAGNDVVGRGTIAGLLGAPGDIAGLVENTYRGTVGLPQVTPYGGSEHIGRILEDAGLVSAERRPGPELLANLLSPSAVAKTAINAPKTARTLLQVADSFDAPSRGIRNARGMYIPRNQMGAITVYHGSPNEFDQFSAMNKIGSGQGGQSFGVGGYHASNKSVASEPQYTGQSGYVYENQLRWPNAVREAKDPLNTKHFIDWDKPFDEQSDYVKSIISNLDEDDWYRVLDNLGEEGDWNTGRAIYDMARLQFDSKAEASKKLYEAGIPGIVFNDADTINRLGTNTPNYVTFSDELVKTITRNGKPVK
jgi:hypothetical protein